MNKVTFFNSLHKQLAEKYNLFPYDVEVIRSRYAQFENREKIVEWITTKLKRPLGEKRRQRNQRILAFIAKSSDEQWKDITQLTDYDIVKAGSFDATKS